MSLGYWNQVQATGFEVPSDRPLDDLTAELTTMLGSTRAEVRDGTAYPALATWIDNGVYDDLLAGLGDGMVAGLAVGLGESGTDTVFRRSFSALIVAECLERDTAHRLLPAARILDWGDRIAVWFLAERDTRGFVPGKGWAHAVAHGADAIGALAESPHLGGPEHEVLLDVLAERVLRQPADEPLASGELDRMAHAAMRVLRRDTLGSDALEPWVHRIAAAGNAFGKGGDSDPFLTTAMPQAYLRALFVHLSLAPDPPEVRSDLLLTVIEALRLTNVHYLQAPTH
ncbi:DUF2785 domain-containing protein [Nocardioides sp. zg-1228]|uniref:DUF2785 domain-containing protein n=1 Tax=Nocardioides sp. zg-1228 TaxID=2763008 RepID=UPI001642B163|nr:DUF2785 domain-containing protein [Nocardioides sp. zg-1228]MBC2934047.1 DUF2785 domain-containing protein [Nocardioides sp. zg-1228]QSF58801.1 DUF2785 domain-containing protein [Nocardioides sp. zg-1228]